MSGHTDLVSAKITAILLTRAALLRRDKDG
jgi:hypothetical protein